MEAIKKQETINVNKNIAVIDVKQTMKMKFFLLEL